MNKNIYVKNKIDDRKQSSENKVDEQKQHNERKITHKQIQVKT